MDYTYIRKIVQAYQTLTHIRVLSNGKLILILDCSLPSCVKRRVRHHPRATNK